MKDTHSDVLNRVATAILTVFGIVTVPIQVAQWLDSPTAGWVTLSGLVLLLGVPSARLLIPSAVQRRFGVARFRAPPILAESIERVSVALDYSATIDTKQTLIFREQPSPDDLVDLLDVLPEHSIEDSAYSTPDSEITGFVRKTPSTLAVRWRPLSPIIPFAPFTHTTRYVTPPLYGDDGFFQAMYVDRETGVKDWEFTCAHPVERAMAFVMPRLGARVTEAYIYRQYARGDARGCEQPSIDEGGRRVRWVLKNPEIGRTYVLFAVYAGMHERILAQAAEQTWTARARLAVAKLFPRLKQHTQPRGTSPN